MPAAGAQTAIWPGRSRGSSIDPAVRTERGFLALCIALPEAGRVALAAIDPDEHITSERLRRAARHLAGQTEMPMTGIAPDDEELARRVADLVQRAGRAGEVTVEQLEHARLLLELARLDRAIRRARGGPGREVGALAREREEVLKAAARDRDQAREGHVRAAPPPPAPVQCAHGRRPNHAIPVRGSSIGRAFGC